MDCCISLDHIQKVCGSGNRIGLKSVLGISCIEDVVNIPAPAAGTHEIQDAIEVRQQFNWNFAKIENGYVAEPEGDIGFQAYKTNINLIIPKLTPLTTHIMNGTANGEYIVSILDNNNQKRLIGEEGDGATITVKEQTGDKNGYVVNIQWTSSYLPYYINDITITETAPNVLEDNNNIVLEDDNAVVIGIFDNN